MADLKIEEALVLAGQLTTIGHPMMHTALLATATDLVSWCKGGIFGGRPWTPAEQAGDLIQQSRLTFGNWERAGGTTALRRLYFSKFDPTKLGAERQTFDSKAWEQKYGTPEPAFAAKLLKVATKSEYTSDRKSMLWQAIRDSIYYTETQMGRADLAQIDDKDDRISAFKYWKEAAKRNQQNHPEDVTAFRIELAQHTWDELMAFDWTKAKGAA